MHGTSQRRGRVSRWAGPGQGAGGKYSRKGQEKSGANDPGLLIC